MVLQINHPYTDITVYSLVPQLDNRPQTGFERMDFEVIGEILAPETFAQGSGILEIARLRKLYGYGRWRKRKGFATVRLTEGSVIDVELHWYEASGIGKREFKIKRYIN